MTRRRTRAALISLFSVLSLSAVAWAKPGVVTTADGKTFEGDVTEKGNVVEVIMKGNIPVKLNRANVANIEYTASPAEQFKQRMAKLDKQDSAGHIELAQWAVDRKEYDLAIEALDAAVEADPNNQDALRMRKVVQDQRRLNRQAAAKGNQAPAAPGTPGAADPGAAQPPAGEMPAAAESGDATDRPEGARGKKRRLVTPDEVNVIRQLELGSNENVTVQLKNGVQRRFQPVSGFTPQEFAKMSPQAQAAEILKAGSREMKKDVFVARDPASLAEFKSAVQRNVLPGCAASACHTVTNPKAGDFVLHSPANKDVETYTNFLLMQEYKGTADGKEYLMVDRQRPEESLVLLFGLPLESSPLPHPKVQNFRPIFKGKTDPKYRAVLNWLESTLAALPPEYGIDLTKPPEDDATTRPTRGGRREAQ